MQDVITDPYLSHSNSPSRKLGINKEDFTKLKALEYKSLYSLVNIEEFNSPITESSLNSVLINKNEKSIAYSYKHIPTQFKVDKQVTVRKTPSKYGISGTYIKGSNKNTRIFLEDQTKENKKNQNRNRTRYRGISYGMLRQFKKRVNKVKKNIVLNILRNKSINLLFYSIQNYFYTKNSLLTLINFEQHTSRLFLNLRSLVFYMSNLYNKGLIFFKFTPTMIFVTWRKCKNIIQSPGSIQKNLYPFVFPSLKSNIIKDTRTLQRLSKNSAGDILTYNLKENTYYDMYNMSQFNLVLNKDVFPLNLGHWIGKMVESSFSFKHSYSMFYLYDVKFNNRHLLRLKNIIKRRYGKKITLNIINLKYLYLDSNILGEAITIKLKDRTKRVLRVLKRIMGLVKTPYYKVHFYNKKRSLEQFKSNFSLLDQTLNLDIDTIDKDIVKNQYLVEKPSNYKPRLLLGHLKHKTVSGIRVEGSGRLTRRLTASRSISKYKYMGTLQNIDSSRESLSTVMLRGDMKSNLQYININSNNRNGAFGVKVSVSSY
jgi:hypothetical protein